MPVTDKELYRRVDHTLLKPTSTWEQICKLCDEAVAHGTASVCIPPSFVSRVHGAYGGKLTICTVIGFPLGYSTTAAKVAEVREAVASGAAEVDMVVNLGDVKEGSFHKVTAEIAALKEAAGDNVLKVIVETCYLTDAEKIRLCKCVCDGGADFIKTSTGFGTGGADLEDIALFQKHLKGNVRIKASGGIRTAADMRAFVEAGCHRLGMSSAVDALEDGKEGGGTY